MYDALGTVLFEQRVDVCVRLPVVHDDGLIQFQRQPDLGFKQRQQSILAWLASGIAPLFAPLGFADWRVSTALITGFMAKESVVSTLTILYGSSAAFAAALSPAAAAPLLVFCLLYTPCIAAVASVKRELGGKWAFIMVANQCIVAWLAAFGTRLIMML